MRYSQLSGLGALTVVFIAVALPTATAIEIIAIRGDPIAGSTPAGTLQNVFEGPVINQVGEVTTTNYLEGTGYDFSNNYVVLSTAGGQISAVAQEGQPAPGTGAGVVFDRYNQGNAPPVINNYGQTAFQAELRGVGVTLNNDHGIFTEAGGQLRLIAREGDAAPGVEPGTVFSQLDNRIPILSDSGQTVFTARVARPVSISPFEEAIYAESSGTLNLVALSGQAPTGTPTHMVYTDFGTPTQNASGHIAFRANLSGSGFGEGIFSGSPGNINTVAYSGMSVPGLGPGEIFYSFNDPAFNSRGQTAFWAILSGGTINFDTEVGLFTESTGELRLFAQSGTPAPLLGTGVNFSYLDEQILIDSGHNVFGAGLYGTGINSNNDYALFREHEGEYEVLVQTGSQAPGAEPGVVFAKPDPTTPLPVVVNANGQVAFLAELAGPDVTFINDTGLFATDSDGNLRLIARTGDTFDIDAAPDATDLQVISHIDMVSGSGGGDGRPTSLNDEGQLAFQLAFRRGQSGIFLASLMATLLGDYSGNGIVDAADYTVWADNFGSTTNLAADGNGDGVVDAADYTIWADNFGSSNTSAITTVPEPAAGLFALWCLSLITQRRSRR